jgi:hypothetical protein
MRRVEPEGSHADEFRHFPLRGKLAEREGLLGPSALAPSGPPSLRAGVQHGCAVLSNPMVLMMMNFAISRCAGNWRRGIDSNCRYGLTRQGFECWRQIRLGQLTEKANAPASELTSRPRRALLVDGSEGRVSDCHWPRVSMWPAMTALGRRQAVRNTSGIGHFQSFSFPKSSR